MNAAATAPVQRPAGRAGSLGDPLPVVRTAVRDLLRDCPEYENLTPDQRRILANAMVRVCYAAASLIRDEVEGGAEIPLPRPAALARAQEAGPGFGGAAARVAGTTKAILNAVSFPAFVTDLINGVFRAMISSTQTQMQMYIELLNGVAASAEGFAASQMGPGGARAWLVEHYPESFEFESSIEDEDTASLTPEELADLQQEKAETRIRLRPDAQAPPEEALRADLGLGPGESVPAAGNPEAGLVPLVRRRLAKMRQEMLATLVQMGMQRIVVDSGRITASMRFHIDTRDAQARDAGSRFSTEHELAAKGSYGVGPWGVSASARSNISYVSTQRTQSTEEMNTDLDLNSSVEINFKSDYVPLNRLASPGQADAIRANSRNPAAEAAAGDAERTRRVTEARGAESRRMDSLDTLLQPAATTIHAPELDDARARRSGSDAAAGRGNTAAQPGAQAGQPARPGVGGEGSQHAAGGGAPPPVSGATHRPAPH